MATAITPQIMVLWLNVASTFLQTQKLGKPQLPAWLITIIVACLIPLVTNVLLPMLGMNAIAERIGPATLPTLMVIAFGGLLYVQYVRFTMRHPLILAIYVGTFIWPVLYLAAAFEGVGVIFPARVMHIGLLLVPAGVLLVQNFNYLNKNYVYFKYILLFFLIFLTYFFVNNLNFVEPVIALRSGASISQVKLHDYFYSFVGIVFLACAFKNVKTPEENFKLFRKVNLYLVIFTLIHCLLTIFGYPFGLFTMVVEGFKRSIGFSYHPNELAKTLGLLLIYFIGLYYYYFRTENKALLKDRLLIGITIVSVILAFLLTLSKNAFLSFAIAIVLFYGLSLFDAKLRSKVLQPVIIFGILMLVLLTGYQIYTGNDLMSTVTDRFNDTRSLEWRYSVWGYLLGNMDGNSVWFGHGLTSSNMELYRFLFDTSKKSSGQSIFVHNAFIGFLYDMGLCGLLVFAGFVSANLHSLKEYLRTREPLFLTVITMTFFIVICSMMDECITELNASLVCWFLVTLAYSHIARPPSVTAEKNPALLYDVETN